VRRLLVAGFSLLAISALLLTRVPAGGYFATDLLPALLLAGVAGGLIAPSAQIGALSGATPSMSGLASGLIETMREVGGAVGVAVVSTVLVTQVGTIAGSGRPAGRALTAVTAFHDAYWVKFAAAALGVLTATTAFPRTTRKSEPATPGPSRGPVDPEPAGQPVSPATGSRPAVRVAAGITDPGKGGWRPSPGGFGVVGSGWVGSFRFAVGWPGVSWPGGNRLFGSRC
jgi:hypothetical protein